MKLRTSLMRTAALLVVAVTFSITAWAAPKFKVLHSFQAGSDGSSPSSPLVFDAAGNLYGTTVVGGNGVGCTNNPYGCGTAFELSLHNQQWLEKVLYNFTVAGPTGNIVLDKKGHLYGIYPGATNIGEAYELMKGLGQWTETTIHSFDYNSDFYPMGGLVADANGNLYGPTQSGGLNGAGDVFELSPNGDGTFSKSVLYAFTLSGSLGPLVLDSAGSFYGSSPFYGAYGAGTIFKLSLLNGVWVETTLYSFTGFENGGSPSTGVTLDRAGNLYGTTQTGGDNNLGIVFKLSPTIGVWNETILHSFTGASDGATPQGRVVLDAAGNVYGTAFAGGLYGFGVVFKLSSSGRGQWKETALHNFTGAGDGWRPQATLVLDRVGNIYGTTIAGGVNNNGVVFEITP